MRAFFETTFGPNELEVLESALTQWRQTHCVSKDDPESEIAAAIMITLFREGYRSLPDLLDAAGKHKGLCDLTAPSREL